MRPAIGYIRVSTAKQGRSGLGIEARQEALQRFAEAEGYRFAETFTEVEAASTAKIIALRLLRPWSAPVRNVRRSSLPSWIGSAGTFTTFRG